VLFDKRDQNQLWQKSCEVIETGSRENFGKETIAGAYRRPKWVLYYGMQADLGRAQDAQAVLRILRLCSGMPILGSG
jgi:hypothetical protein